MQIGEDLHDPASNASNTINNINNISNINRSITSLLLLLMIVFQTANTIIIIIIIHLEIISIIFIDFYCFQFEMIWKTNRRRWREKPHRLISDTPSGRYQPSNLNLAPSVRSGCCSSSGSQVNGGRGLAATGMVAGWWRDGGGRQAALRSHQSNFQRLDRLMASMTDVINRRSIRLSDRGARIVIRNSANQLTPAI